MISLYTFEVMGGISLFAGFVSAIAGASGLIILPALLLTGMPPHFALGTNRLYTTASLFTSAICFMKSGLFQPRYWIAAIVAAIGGTLTGVVLSLFLSADILKKALPIFIILIAIYLLIPKKKNIPDKADNPAKPYPLMTIIISGLLGVYSGFLGAGTGSIWTSAATEFFKIDFMEASAMSRFMCFVTNLVALFVFVFLNRVDYMLGIFMALFGALGAYVGVRAAVYLGDKFVRFGVIACTLTMAVDLAVTNWV